MSWRHWMVEYRTASSEGKKFFRDAHIIQQFRDLGMGQASMRWDAVPRKVSSCFAEAGGEALLLRGHERGADGAEV